MTNLHGRIPTRGKEYTEHDDSENRKRVATYVDGNTVSYEDSNFTVGESPVVLDFFTDSGRIGHEGSIVNDGPGNMLIEISDDGTNYGGQHTLLGGESMELSNLTIKRIRLTASQITEYRVSIA